MMNIIGWIQFAWTLIKLYPTVKAAWDKANNHPQGTPALASSALSVAIQSIGNETPMTMKTADGQTITFGLTSNGTVK
jgi:hypothetical protein